MRAWYHPYDFLQWRPAIAYKSPVAKGERQLQDARQASEAEPRCPHDMRQRPHFGENGLIDALVDADKRNRLAARLLTAEIEGCDVYTLIAEQRAERTDMPRLVGIL